MFKKYFANPYFLLLLFGNLYCIWYFQNHTNGFATVVWIYWLQTITIGFFNFVDLLTIKNYDPGGATLNDQPITEKNKGCLPWFFLVHFGIFNFVYGIFLLVRVGVSSVDRIFLLIGVAAFFLEILSGFIKRKIAERHYRFNIGSLFFLPYLRVVPMHLMILAPAFFNVEPSMLFLILKMIADILSNVLYQHMYEKAMVPAGVSSSGETFTTL